MSLRSIVKRIIFRPKTDTAKLIDEASRTPRYQLHDFSFRGMQFLVTDFISVAWQLKEFFDDGRLEFTSESAAPLIYDCGANVGVSVLYFKKLYPDARIKAFEPDPKIFECLQQNISANKVTGVELHNKAVWNSSEGVQFASEGADGGSIYFEGRKTTLPSVRLKDILSGEKYIDLLKIDIEGAELEVLKDCDTELKKVRFLFVEYHSWLNQEQKLDELLAILRRNGFRYYIHDIGEKVKAPFVERKFPNGMDVQLDIHAINERIKV